MLNKIKKILPRFVKNSLRDLYNFFSGPVKSLNILQDRAKFLAADKNKRFSCKFSDFYFQLNDNTSDTGFDAHYIYHPAWAARIVRELQPLKHVDISSTLNFCSLLSAFIPTEFYDYRPAKLNLDNLKSAHCDLTDLHFADNSIKSLSCMHTVEHVGLGRYGDLVAPDDDLKAMTELKRVLAVGGDLLFVVPVGRPRIMFNAHRIYSFDMIKGAFAGLELKEFAMVFDDGSFVRNADFREVAKQEYACGCFWFKKTQALN